MRRAVVRIGASLALLVAPRAAGAEGDALREAAERVAGEWAAAGAHVERLPARFLYENDTMTVTLPLPPPEASECTTIALLGARGISFHARVADAEDEGSDSDPEARASSVAGVLEISSCGDTDAPILRLRVTSDAGRGAIEGVVARSAKALAALRSVLPERSGGALPPPPDAGPVPPLPPQRDRADLAEARARRDGARIEGRATWSASGDGSGDAKLALEPGCHRIEVFAPESHGQRGRRRRLDLDAEIRDEDDELLGRDRTDSPDVRLDVCVGDPTASTVIFAGAPPGSQLLATHASWSVPDHLPVVWGTEPRTRMARALLARHASPPTEDAVALLAGPSGMTPIAIALEPGACYLAAAAVTHGHAHGLGLRVAVGARDVRDERTSDDDAGVVAFCAGDRNRALFVVEARGVSLSWGLALFRVASGAWETR